MIQVLELEHTVPEVLIGLTADIHLSQSEVHPLLNRDVDFAAVVEAAAEVVQSPKECISQVIIIAHICSNDGAGVIIKVSYFLLCPAELHISICANVLLEPVQLPYSDFTTCRFNQMFV